MPVTDSKNQQGPVRTLKVGDRITVYGDLEVIAVNGRRVQVRVVSASAPVMFAVKKEDEKPRPTVQREIDR